MEACVLGLEDRAGSWFVVAWASWQKRPAARAPPVFRNRRRLVKEGGCFMRDLSDWATRTTLIAPCDRTPASSRAPIKLEGHATFLSRSYVQLRYTAEVS